jgi:anti-sigma factor RsiW
MKLTCKEASRLISAGLDTKLSLADRTALRLHLALCDACNKLKAQFEFLRRALAAYAKSDDDERR